MAGEVLCFVGVCVGYFLWTYIFFLFWEKKYNEPHHLDFIVINILHFFPPEEQYFKANSSYVVTTCFVF